MYKSIMKLLSVTLILVVTISLFAQDNAGGEDAPASKPAASKEGTPKSSLDFGDKSSDITAEQEDPSVQYSTADKPEDNYLARFHALEKIDYLQHANLEQIFMLNVIQQNFNSDNLKTKYSDWEEEYNKVYEGYKNAMDLYYRRKVIYAAVKLEENRKKINYLYETISDQYRADTLDLLNQCADNILILSLDAKSASNPNSNKKLFNQLNRLRVAYGQVDDAEEARVKRLYQTSVFHYRVAKSYAISILEDINPETYIGDESVKKQLDVHKADNKNRIFSGETTATEVKEKQSDIEKANQDNKTPEAY